MTREECFQVAVVRYSAGDVRALLDASMRECGPLLACTVNGIDLLGGVILGFSAGNAKRSTHVMQSLMGCSTEIAALLFKSVRCGLEHQGMPNYGINFFQVRERLHRDVIFYRDEKDLWLNISELAHLYLAAVDTVIEDPSTYIHHMPLIKQTDEKQFLEAAGQVYRNITELCQALDNDREDPRTSGSKSAAMPDNTLPPPLHIPPE